MPSQIGPEERLRIQAKEQPETALYARDEVKRPLPTHLCQEDSGGAGLGQQRDRSDGNPIREGRLQPHRSGRWQE